MILDISLILASRDSLTDDDGSGSSLAFFLSFFSFLLSSGPWLPVRWILPTAIKFPSKATASAYINSKVIDLLSHSATEKSGSKAAEYATMAAVSVGWMVEGIL